MTPEQLLESDSLTAWLKAKGWTDEELQDSKFWLWNPELPFATWSFTFPGHRDLKELDAARLKAHLALRWLLIDRPPGSRNRDDAREFVASVKSAPLNDDWALIVSGKAIPLMDAGRRYRETQRRRATKRRGVLWSDGPTMKELIEDLATRPDLDAEAPKGLWPHLYSKLTEEGLSPLEASNHSAPRKSVLTYEPGSTARGDDPPRKSITYGRFCTIVSHARKIRRHASRAKE